jgi:hypothetical protein
MAQSTNFHAYALNSPLASKRVEMYVSTMQEETKVSQGFKDNPLFLEVMAEALAIQDRFAAEPVYAKTGVGYLKSVGVSEIQKAKDQMRAQRAQDYPSNP